MAVDLFPESRSQVHQDLFVLAATKKRCGFFIEIGGFHSENLSNTFLLEKQFGWMGVTVEILKDNAEEIRRNRSAAVICEDATRVKWRSKMREYGIPRTPDYLQVDCEPALSSLLALLRVLRAGIRPKLITFEHDVYSGARLLGLVDQGRFVRFSSRAVLRSLGYRLLAPNILTKSGKPFEDWWVRRPARGFVSTQPSSGQTNHADFLEKEGLYVAYQKLKEQG